MAGNTFSAGGPKAAARSQAATGNAGNVSEKEDLANFISMISRDEVPFLSNIGRSKATAIFHEWQTDTLSPPVAGEVAEGVSYATQTAAQAAEPFRTRLGNYCQINSKTVTVTGTKRAVDQAGVADEYAYQLKKRGVEMRRDQELGLVHTVQDKSGSSPRTFGGYQAWANVNVKELEAGGATYTAPTNTGAGEVGTFSGYVDGTDRTALALSHVDDLMQTIYQQGGKATKLMLSPANKKAFSARCNASGSINTVRNIDEKGRLRQSVEFYESDFGDIMVVPNYIMGLSLADPVTGLNDSADFFGLLYDPMWFSWASLRPMQEVDLGQLGDSIIGQIVEEATLECKNPSGAGLIVGLSGA